MKFLNKNNVFLKYFVRIIFSYIEDFNLISRKNKFHYGENGISTAYEMRPESTRYCAQNMCCTQKRIHYVG